MSTPVCTCVCAWVCVPVNSRPKSLFPLQHLQDEFAPLLLQVIGMEALRKLNTTKFYPHLHRHKHITAASHHASAQAHKGLFHWSRRTILMQS